MIVVDTQQCPLEGILKKNLTEHHALPSLGPSRLSRVDAHACLCDNVTKRKN